MIWINADTSNKHNFYTLGGGGLAGDTEFVLLALGWLCGGGGGGGGCMTLHLGGGGGFGGGVLSLP